VARSVAERRAIASVVALGAAHALLSALLGLQGIAARAVLLPIAIDRYYLAQAVFVGPLDALLAWLFARTALRLAGLGEVARRDTLPQLVTVYASCLLALFVVPDLVVYLVAGHGALARAMRFYAPLVPLAMVAATTWTLRRRYDVGVARAASASLVGLVLQALVGAVVLR
jgi:hypothetical protein